MNSGVMCVGVCVRFCKYVSVKEKLVRSKAQTYVLTVKLHWHSISVCWGGCSHTSKHEKGRAKECFCACGEACNTQVDRND